MVFLSHSSLDKKLAAKLARSLLANGIDVWLDKWEIAPGDSFRQKIDSGLKQANSFIVLLTLNSLKSDWVQTEIDSAMVRRIEGTCRLIPVLCGLDFKDIPPTLRGLHAVNLTDYEYGLQCLIDVCHGISRKPQLVPRPLEARELEITQTYLNGLKELIIKARTFRGDLLMFVDPILRLRKRKKIDGETTRNNESLFIYEIIRLETLISNPVDNKRGYSIVADSGMGKTMLLEELALRISDGIIETNRIPVLLQFSHLTNVKSSDDIIQIIKDEFSQWVKISDHAIGGWFEQNRFCFLIDGLDQVVGRETHFLTCILGRNTFRGNTCIFTSRPFAYSMLDSSLLISENYNYIEIGFLEDIQIKTYLSNDYDEIIKMLSFSHELFRIPILISHIKSLHKHGFMNNIKTRADLYREIISKLFVHEKDHWVLSGTSYSSKDLVHYFKELSFLTLSNGNIGHFSRLLPKEGLDILCISRETFESLLRIGIIHEVIEGDREEIVYRHQSFQEYFASLRFAEVIFKDGKPDEDTLRKYVDYKYWDEVWIFLIGGLEKVQAKSIIAFIMKYDEYLATLCLLGYRGKNKDFKSLIDRMLGNLIWPNDVKAQNVVLRLAMADPDIESTLIRLVIECSSPICLRAAELLGKMKSEKAIMPLLRLLGDVDGNVVFTAKEALNMIKSDDQLNYFIESIEDDKVRRTCRYLLNEGFMSNVVPDYD